MRLCILMIATLLCTACTPQHYSEIEFIGLEPAPASEQSDLLLTFRAESVTLPTDIKYVIYVSQCPYNENTYFSVTAIDYKKSKAKWTAQDRHIFVADLYYNKPFDQYRDEHQRAVSYQRPPLPTSPQDLCFKVMDGGFSYLLGGQSDEVRIPKEALIHALKGQHENTQSPKS